MDSNFIFFSRSLPPVPLLHSGEVRTEMVEAAGYSGASDDYYEVNPTLDPENIAAGVLFMLQLPYKVQVSLHNRLIRFKRCFIAITLYR